MERDWQESTGGRCGGDGYLPANGLLLNPVIRVRIASFPPRAVHGRGRQNSFIQDRERTVIQNFFSVIPDMM